MAQADLIIPNSNGYVFRQNINAALNALATQNSGPAAPFPTYPGMMWLDTSTNPDGIRRTRNAANTGWIQDYAIDQTARDTADFALEQALNRVHKFGDTMTGTLNFLQNDPPGVAKTIIRTDDNTGHIMGIIADWYTLKFVDFANDFTGFEYVFNGGEAFAYMSVTGPVTSIGPTAGFSFRDRNDPGSWDLFARDGAMRFNYGSQDIFTAETTGLVTFMTRPQFGLATPWDSANFTPPTLNGDAGTFYNGQGDFVTVPGTVTYPGGTTAFLRADGAWAVPPGGGGGGSADWGTIGGVLTDQTDLVAALDLKANDADVVKLSGDQTIFNVKNFRNGVHAQANSSGDSPVVYLKDVTGLNRSTYFYDQSDNAVKITRYNADASAIAGILRFDATTITFNGNALLTAAVPYLPLAGGTMTGPITQANGNTFLQTAAGAKILSGPAGNTIVIQAAIPGAAGLAVRNSAGTDVFGAGASAVTSYLVADMNAGARIFNAGQLKVYDQNNDTPVELGLGYSSGSDRNAYLWNRNNGWLEFGTNATPRLRINSLGNIDAYNIIGTFVGGVSTQQVLTQHGWNNLIPRWKTVIEGDASFSLYSYDTAGGAPARAFNVIGSSMGTPRIVSHGHEVATTGTNNNYRTVVGNYGTFWHMNSTHLYLMLTDSGNQWGSWNGLRPFYVDLANGNVVHAHDVSVQGNVWIGSSLNVNTNIQSSNTNLILAATGGIVALRPNGAGSGAGQLYVAADGQTHATAAIWSHGAGAALYFEDRATATGWAWYCVSNVARLYNGASDVFTVNNVGTMVAQGNGAFGGILTVQGGPQLSNDGGDFRVETSVKVVGRYKTLTANGAAWLVEPRVFVQSGDPGAQASDGDLWAW